MCASATLVQRELSDRVRDDREQGPVPLVLRATERRVTAAQDAR